MTKPLSEFTKNKVCRGGVTSQCKECINVYQEKFRKVKYKDNPDFKKRRQLSQEKLRAKTYGLSLEELKTMVDNNPVCEICGGLPSGKGTSGKVLHVDHCHSTGKVRGMLCARCNLILGMAEDDELLLVKMSKYLGKHKEEACTST